MRELTGHKVNGCNESIGITVVDEPGCGGSCHAYDLHLLSAPGVSPGITAEQWTTKLRFQNGPIGTAGVNGITHEALLAVLIDRLEGFQSGKYACAENADTLAALQHAQSILKSRTEKRLARGVEGTHTV